MRRANADLLRRVDALSAEKMEADEKLVKLQIDLDCELGAQRSQEGLLDRFWKEFQTTESMLQHEPSRAWEELEKRDSELQPASQRLEVANWQTEGVKAELDRERNVFQSENDDLLRKLEQVLADKAEAEKQADEIARLEKEVKVFKLMKYQHIYNDVVQGKQPRYPLGAGASAQTKGQWKSWPPIAPSMPDASATALVVGASRDPLPSVALAAG